MHSTTPEPLIEALRNAAAAGDQEAAAFLLIFGSWHRTYLGQHEREFHIACQIEPDVDSPEAIQACTLRAENMGETKRESSVRYIGIEVDDALEIAEQTDV